VGTVRGFRVKVFFVVWRCGRFKGAITLTGPVGRFEARDAVRLARRQSRRMPC
jgi:hypothetical protein